MTTARILVANVVYTNRPGKIRDALHELIVFHQPDVLMLCETKNVNVDGILPDEWCTHQGIKWDLARANNAISWRPPLKAGRRRFILGTLPLGADMLTRWINRVRLYYGLVGRPVGFDVMHLPPSRYDSLTPAFMRQIEQHTANRYKVWAGDANNAPIRQLGETYGLETRAAGVMFLATNLPIRRFRVVRHDAFDHAVLIVDVDMP